MHVPRVPFPPNARVLVAVLAPLATAAAPGGEPARGVEIRTEPEKTAIGNAFLAIEFSTEGKKLRTAAVTNRLTDLTTPLVGEDFVFVFEPQGEGPGRTVRSSEFSLAAQSEEPADGGGKRLAFDLSRDDIEVRSYVELRPDEPWATRWVEVRKGSGRLAKISLSEWRVLGSYGPPGPGRTLEGLGAPQGLGQVAYVEDLFYGIAHPGAENFARGKRISARISAFDELGGGKTFATPKCVLGAGETGGAPQAFLRWVGEHRASAPRQTILLSAEGPEGVRSALEAAAAAKAAGGPPIATVLLSGAWDARAGTALPWTALDPQAFPGGWDALSSEARAAGVGIALRIAPPEGRAGGAERFCPYGAEGRKRLAEAVSGWIARGVLGIELDGFRPDCAERAHGHPTGPGAEAAQMDALIGAARAWRGAKAEIQVAHLAGSNPSPFWLAHVDFLSPGGLETAAGAAAASGAGDGPSADERLERSATSIDERLQAHRPTEMPISAFAVADLDGKLASRASDAAFERYAWWLVARTALRHRWDVRPSDLSPERWKALGAAFRWGAAHERLFRSSRMVGGDARQGGIYGFSAMDGGTGVLSLRNPSPKAGALERPLSSLLAISRAASKKDYRLRGIYGETKALEGVFAGRSPFKVELPPYGIAILEVSEE